VHVEVKTSDKQTAVALRSELSELARAVQDRGYHIDTWTPSDTAPANMHEPGEPSQQPSWSEGEHQRQTTGDTEQDRDQRKKHIHDPEWLIELQRRLSGEEG
jgi:hypothetical protein